MYSRSSPASLPSCFAAGFLVCCLAYLYRTLNRGRDRFVGTAGAERMGNMYGQSIKWRELGSDFTKRGRGREGGRGQMKPRVVGSQKRGEKKDEYHKIQESPILNDISAIDREKSVRTIRTKYKLPLPVYPKFCADLLKQINWRLLWEGYIQMCRTFRYFLLSITLLAAVYASPSNPIPKTAGIEAGTVLYATASMNSINIRNIPLSWVAPNTQIVQSSASMVHFSNHSNANGFDYMLNTKFVPSTKSLLILFVFRYIGWASICVSYIATTNPSIFTSSFLINTLDTIDCSVPATSLSYTTLVPNWQPVNTSQILIIAVFISGIRTSNTNLYVTLNILFDESTGKLTSLVNFNSQTPNVEILKLGYLIVLNSPTTMFTFLTPMGSMPGGDINFVETAGVVAQSIVLRTIQFYNNKFYCQGPNCTSIYVNSLTCTAQGGNLLDKYCIICQPDQVWRRNSCLCQPNYFLYLGVCKACPSGVAPTYNLTVCIPTTTTATTTSIPSPLTGATRSQPVTNSISNPPTTPTMSISSPTVTIRSAPATSAGKARGKK